MVTDSSFIEAIRVINKDEHLFVYSILKIVLIPSLFFQIAYHAYILKIKKEYGLEKLSLKIIICIESFSSGFH